MHTLVKNRFLAYASNQDPNLDWDFHADSYAAMALHAGEYYLKKRARSQRNRDLEGLAKSDGYSTDWIDG